MAPHHKLISIRFSHYNEIARWALDVAGVSYSERGYLPLLHIVGVLWHGGGWSSKADKQSTRFSTPLLILNTGEHLHDSLLILRRARALGGGPNLLPTDEVETVVARFHRALGGHTRRVAYWWLLRDWPTTCRVAQRNCGTMQATIFSALRWLIRPAMYSGLQLTAPRVEDSLARVRVEFDFAGELLKSGGGEYLVGGAFSGADLVFAALAAPLLLVSEEEGYGAVFPGRGEVPRGLQDVVEELRAHPAGVHAMRMFREHRGRRMGLGVKRGVALNPRNVTAA